MFLGPTLGKFMGFRGVAWLGWFSFWSTFSFFFLTFVEFLEIFLMADLGDHLKTDASNHKNHHKIHVSHRMFCYINPATRGGKKTPNHFRTPSCIGNRTLLWKKQRWILWWKNPGEKPVPQKTQNETRSSGALVFSFHKKNGWIFVVVGHFHILSKAFYLWLQRHVWPFDINLQSHMGDAN